MLDFGFGYCTAVYSIATRMWLINRGSQYFTEGKFVSTSLGKKYSLGIWDLSIVGLKTRRTQWITRYSSRSYQEQIYPKLVRGVARAIGRYTAPISSAFSSNERCCCCCCCCCLGCGLGRRHDERPDVVARGFVVLYVAPVTERKRSRLPAPAEHFLFASRESQVRHNLVFMHS